MLLRIDGHHSVALDDLLVVAASPLPASAASWPVRAVHAPPQAPREPYVLCGPASAVQELLERFALLPPYPRPARGRAERRRWAIARGAAQVKKMKGRRS